MRPFLMFMNNVSIVLLVFKNVYQINKRCEKQYAF